MSAGPVSPCKPLAARDPNTSSPTKPATNSQEKTEKVAPQSMEYHRQVLQNRLAAENAYVSLIPPFPPASLSSPNPCLPYRPLCEKQQRNKLIHPSSSRYSDKQTYISPSDTIMSPCTAKLSAYKGKKFAKYVFPPSLALASANTASEDAACGLCYADGVCYA